MRLHSFFYPVLLAGLGSIFVEADSGAAALHLSHEAKDSSSQGTPGDAPTTGVSALVEASSNEVNDSNPSAELQSEINASQDSSERGPVDAGNHIIRGHLHIDLSLGTNVALVARLAPLMLRLIAEQKALASPIAARGALSPGSSTPDVLEGSSEGSADSVDTAKMTLPHGLSPEIQLEFSYHIFNMEEDVTSAPHCITGNLGRFCAFPPDVTTAGSSEQQVGGRGVVEETLLRLCLSKLAHKHVLPETAAPAQMKNTNMPDHFDSNTQGVSPLWRYIDLWRCNCSKLNKGCDHQTTAATAEENHKTGIHQDDRAGRTGTGESSAFEATCSRAQLAKLYIHADTFMKNCEKAAEVLLQDQVDSQLSVVPSLLIDGKPALGELTAASVMKTLCLVAEEREAAAAAFPGAPAPQLPAVCRESGVVNSSALVVKSYGIGVNTEFISSIEDGGAPGELGVAAHLLNMYGRTPEGAAAQSAAASTRHGMDPDGRYHFVNPTALRFLRKRVLARRSLRKRKTIPVVSAEGDPTASLSESSEAAVLPVPSEDIHVKSYAAIERESAAAASGSGDEAPAEGEGSRSASSVYRKPAAAGKMNAVSKETAREDAVPLTLDAPPSGLSSVPLSGKTIHLEAGKVSAPAVEQFVDTTKPAGVSPSSGEKTRSAASVVSGSAAVDARFNIFGGLSMSEVLYLLFVFVLLMTAIAWFYMRRRRNAVPCSRQQRETAPHQTALLDNKFVQAVPRRDL